MDDAVAVNCGTFATAAIKSDGSLWMWGASVYGCLGLGNTPDSTSGPIAAKGGPISSIVPAKVMNDVSAVSTSGSHTVAIKNDGSLWAWGYNRYGQLGNSGVSDIGDSYTLDRYQSVPVKVVDGMALPNSATVPVSPAVAGFTDVHESDYYAQAVAWAKENGVTSGTSTTTFSPAASVTRAQAVTFLWRAAGSPEPSTMVSPFTDVTDSSAYYYKAILWAAEHDIAGGIGNNLFGLNNTLTYDQILALLCRTAGASASGSDWSAAAVTWATKNGLTDGLTFTAKDNCPRADVVYCLWKQLA